MERIVAQLDEAGAPVLDEAGEPVMVPNQARASLVGATSLATALGMGMLAYALSVLAVFSGVVLVAVGVALRSLDRRRRPADRSPAPPVWPHRPEGRPVAVTSPLTAAGATAAEPCHTNRSGHVVGCFR